MSDTRVCFPNYDDSILSLSHSILKHYGVSSDYATLSDLDAVLKRGYKNVVVMVFDGMGVDLLEKTLSSRSFLRQHLVRSISSVFPPTTCAAMSTYRSALPPIVHGWLAWACYFKEYKKVIELYRNSDLYTQEKLNVPPVADQLPYEPIWDKINRVTGGGVQARSIYPASIPNGSAETLSEWFREIRATCGKEGRQYVFAYWNEPDHTMHNQGTYAPDVREIVRDINRRIRTLSAQLTDTLLIVSADHGHTPLEEVVYIDDIEDMVDCLSRPLSLDDRTVSIALKPGRRDRFLDLFNRYLSQDFILFSRQEVLDRHLFGYGKPHERALDFIGDYIISSISGKSICQHQPGEVIPDLKSAHAGLTRAEMRVPLILVDLKK